MPADGLLIVTTAAASVGAALLVWGVLSLTGDLARLLGRRLRPGALSAGDLAARLRALGTAAGQSAPQGLTVARRLHPRWPLPAVGAAVYAVAGALLARDLVLSPYLLGLGAAAAVFLARVGVRPVDLSGQVALLISAFRSQYRARPTVFAALGESADILPPGAVRQAVETACAYNRVARPDALAVLYELKDETLSQLVRALETDTTPQAMARLLKDLEDRLKARKRVQEAAQGALALFMGTIYVLAGANLLFALVVLVVPLMRYYFIDQPDGKLLYMAVTLAAAGGGAYFLLETRAVEEQVA